MISKNGEKTNKMVETFRSIKNQFIFFPTLTAEYQADIMRKSKNNQSISRFYLDFILPYYSKTIKKNVEKSEEKWRKL